MLLSPKFVFTHDWSCVGLIRLIFSSNFLLYKMCKISSPNLYIGNHSVVDKVGTKNLPTSCAEWTNSFANALFEIKSLRIKHIGNIQFNTIC